MPTMIHPEDHVFEKQGGLIQDNRVTQAQAAPVSCGAGGPWKVMASRGLSSPAKPQSRDKPPASPQRGLCSWLDFQDGLKAP